MLRAARKKANEIGLENLELKKSKDPEIPFPDKCADMAMLGFVLHETGSIRRFLSEVRRVLKRDGWVVLMEWHPRPTDYGPPLWARLSPPETRRAVRAAGLAVSGSWSYDNDTYFVVARHKNVRSITGSFSAKIQKITKHEV
jgi:ubiquinone/menaquinone biosynthesis C-methylase UbiE